MKKVFYCLGIALLITMLVGCQSSNTSTSTPTEQEESNPTTSSNSETKTKDESGLESFEVTMYQGPPQGTWGPVANAIKRAVEDSFPGSEVKLEAGGGAANILAINSGQGDFAMVVSTSAIDATQGKAPFETAMNDFREVAVLYEQPVQLLTFDSNIKSIEDLKGKNVSVMPKGYGAEVVNQMILKAAGMSYDDIEEQHLGEVDSAQNLRDGHLDAIMYGNYYPNSVTIDLSSTGNLHFFSLSDEIISTLSGYNEALHEYIIPAGSYDGLNEDLKTISSSVNIMANKDVPAETVKAFTQALVEGLPKFQEQLEFFKTMTPEGMARDVGIPFHPGAEAYYKEANFLLK
ncbi:TAXI family TRAP transporter solute-binding subunit [Bacillus sp. Marseille-P3661]|uniref:TAXI family TRAP transporter solute-binding subunit n=1 Tax=Bacillus sp. Marseille-P3661 TaxID=1936234 RepID=UPI000C85D96C|nr:TAXI family TRAP transporter solute-binding subunit [Bacillus sp. Marseille-P3661]